MKEPYNEGIANHVDPESCGGIRKGAAEALTGAPVGPAIEPRKCCSPGGRCHSVEQKTIAEYPLEQGCSDPARSLEPGHVGKPPAREPGDPPSARVPWQHGTLREAQGHNPEMDGRGKSYRLIISTKPPNKVDKTAEAVEKRSLAKRNSHRQNTGRTQSRGTVQNALGRIRQLAEKDKEQRLTSLFHHVYNPTTLREAFFELKRDAAPGVDGITWKEYHDQLEGNLLGVSERLGRGAYRAKPVKRSYIPKPDGRRRPIGVTTTEDKLVQRAVVKVLNTIYETDFAGFSYGFRPGKSQHEALDALNVGLTRKRINWVLDADIRGFFDAIDHDWLMKFIEHRVADPRILRLIRKWLNAGVMENGTRTYEETGCPQGGSVCPLLANIYLHYVFDLWTQQWRSRKASGDIVAVRWADDFIVGFESKRDAERFLADLRDRFQKFNLELHPEKTQLIEFGRFAEENRRRRGERRPTTFDFLGFTHYCSKTRKGWFKVKRRTMKTRMRRKLKEVKTELRRRINVAIPDQGRWLGSILRGHYQYYGVPWNYPAMKAFRMAVIRLWKQLILRRSQKSRCPWKRMWRIVDRWLPRPRIVHPYPYLRKAVRT